MRSDRSFFVLLATLAGGYVLLLAAMLLAEASYTHPGKVGEVLGRSAIQRSILLTVVSSSVATAAALVVGVLVAYLMARTRFRGRWLVELVLDLPNILPPLVLGLCLLTLFKTPLLEPISSYVIYQLPAVFIAQFVVAMAAAVPVLRAAFDQASPDQEQTALVHGGSRWQAFWHVALPQVRPGLLTAAALAWAKCFGCFGPLLVFAGATRNKTEVLATTIYLELTAGDLEAAVAVSLVMVAVSVVVLTLARWWGTPKRP